MRTGGANCSSTSAASTSVQHPYAMDPAGRIESVSRLSGENLRKFHDQYLVGPTSILAVFGDFDEAAVEQQVRELFGGLPGPGAPCLCDQRPDRRQSRQAVHQDQGAGPPGGRCVYRVPVGRLYRRQGTVRHDRTGYDRLGLPDAVRLAARGPPRRDEQVRLRGPRDQLARPEGRLLPDLRRHAARAGLQGDLDHPGPDGQGSRGQVRDRGALSGPRA